MASIDRRPIRTKSERIRLNLTQQQAAGHCGITRGQWVRYESGASVFDGAPLRAFSKIGADINYIITGIRKTQIQAQQSNTLGARLIEERVRLRYKQNEICKALKVEKKTLYNYERGISQLPSRLDQVLIGMGYDMHYVLTGERAKNSETAPISLNQPAISDEFENTKALYLLIASRLSEANSTKELHDAMIMNGRIDASLIYTAMRSATFSLIRMLQQAQGGAE